MVGTKDVGQECMLLSSTYSLTSQAQWEVGTNLMQNNNAFVIFYLLLFSLKTGKGLD